VRSQHSPVKRCCGWGGYCAASLATPLHGVGMGIDWGTWFRCLERRGKMAVQVDLYTYLAIRNILGALNSTGPNQHACA